MRLLTANVVSRYDPGKEPLGQQSDDRFSVASRRRRHHHGRDPRILQTLQHLARTGPPLSAPLGEPAPDARHPLVDSLVDLHGHAELLEALSRSAQASPDQPAANL